MWGVEPRIEHAPTYHQLVIIITITFINSNLIIVASVCHFSACTNNTVTICAFIKSLPAGPMLKVLSICPQMELVISAKLREMLISKLVIL